MLSIYLYGEVENGWLDLNPGTLLDMESLEDIFDEDLSTGEYSLPVDVPWTDNNKRLMRFAERIENFKPGQYFWKVDVYHKGWPEIQGGKMVALDKAGRFDYRKGSFKTTVSGSKGLFGRQIQGKLMNQLTLGGPIHWGTFFSGNSRSFATKVMKGDYPQYSSYIGFAPIAWYDYLNEAVAANSADEIINGGIINQIVHTGFDQNDWVFGIPDPTDPTKPVLASEFTYKNYRTIPFLKFQFVLRAIFNEHNWSVTGALIDEDDFKDMYVFNNTAIESYGYGSAYWLDYNQSIFPEMHVPDVTIKDFLKSVLGFLGVYAVFENNRVTLKRRVDVLRRQTVDISPLVSTDFETQNDNNTESGYKLNYQWESSDGMFSERVKDLSGKIMAGTVNLESDLFTIGGALTTDHIAYVVAENMYYRVANAGAGLWEPFSEGLEPFVKGDGQRSVDYGVSTLCNEVTFDSAAGLFKRMPYLCTRQRGSYRYILLNGRPYGASYAGGFEKNNCGIRLFYITKQIYNWNTIPVSHNTANTRFGTKVAGYDLSWNGDAGIGKNFHEAWEDFKSRGEVVKTDMIRDAKIEEQLKDKNVMINGTVYVPYKNERSIGSNGVRKQYLRPI